MVFADLVVNAHLAFLFRHEFSPFLTGFAAFSIMLPFFPAGHPGSASHLLSRNVPCLRETDIISEKGGRVLLKNINFVKYTIESRPIMSYFYLSLKRCAGKTITVAVRNSWGRHVRK
jgi:hypothetical protein